MRRRRWPLPVTAALDALQVTKVAVAHLCRIRFVRVYVKLKFELGANPHHNITECDLSGPLDTHAEHAERRGRI